MNSEGAISVGLVFGAGGRAAEAWHSGVLSGVLDATGWDPRSAELILGTSAGAITGLCLRAEIPVGDLYARQLDQPISDEGQRIIDRVTTPHADGSSDRSWTDWGPQSPPMAARALWPPWQARPLHLAAGLSPRGMRTNETLGQRMAELHPEPWPRRRFWVTAVRLGDGERVVFGRDDVPAGLSDAIRASCAIPAIYEPVDVEGREYVDGGVHSYTNADLMGPPAFDMVLVSSVMSGDPGWSAASRGLCEAWETAQTGMGLGGRTRSEAPRPWLPHALSQAWSSGRAMRTWRRQWMGDRLREEVDGLRRRDIAVLVVDPDPETVDLIDSGPGNDDDERRAWAAGIAVAANRAARQQFATADGQRIAARLRRASV